MPRPGVPILVGSRGREGCLFNASFDVPLRDPTRTKFEANPPFSGSDKWRFGYSRDHTGRALEERKRLSNVLTSMY